MLSQTMYTTGDLIVVNSTKYAEIVGVTPDNTIEASFLVRTNQQEGRIWQFSPDDEWELVQPSQVTKHVPIPEGSDGNTVVNAWKEIGFVAGGDGMTFCRIEDERVSTLPLLLCEDDSETEGTPSTNESMHGYEEDGFVVPDEDGEEFTFAIMDDLDDDAAKFVMETHKAVHDFDNWQPKDKQGKGIKAYIENMDRKVSIETDNQCFARGKSSISTSKPPLKRKRKQ